MEAISNHQPRFPLTNKGNRDPSMEKFKEALIKFVDLNPSLFQHDGYNFYLSLIEQRFSQNFLDFQTPDHPPYAFMIHRAIKGLNEKRGSSEESISKYIKQEYNDLPWAHSTLLKHHLEKLCDRKELSMTPKQCYLILDAHSDPISEKPLKRKQSLVSLKKSSRPHKKRKKNKQDAELGKRSRKHHKKCKKKEKLQLDLEKTNQKIVEGIQEQEQDLSLLDKLADEQENVMKNGLHEAKYLRIEGNNLIDVCIQESTHSEEKAEIRATKKQRGKCQKKHDINEKTQLQASNEEDLKQNNEVNTSDIQTQEQNEVKSSGHPDKSGHISSGQNPKGKRVLTKSKLKMLKRVKNPQNQSKQVWTKSRIKKISKKEALAISEAQEKQEEIGEGKQASTEVSTELIEQQTKPRSSQKKKDHLERMDSLNTPLKELLDPSTKLRRSSRKRKDRMPLD